MIEQYDGPKKAREFIGQNLQYPEFRKMAIENAMKEKDYDAVIKLTLDGEEKDKDRHGLVDQWKKYRYKVFQLSGKLMICAKLPWSLFWMAVLNITWS